jgi:fumarylacetoacetase
MNSTTDPQLRSFIAVAADSHFPIQNLPYGVFRRAGSTEPPRVGVAIGELVLDLACLEQHGLFDLAELGILPVFDQPALNDFMRLGPAAWRAVRQQVSTLLRVDEPRLRDDAALRAEALIPRIDCELLVPCRIGDYTDFYSSREHATNVGTLLRGADNALLPNWLHLPVAYHGRSSSIVASGTPIRRPRGQTRPDDAAPPIFGPTRSLDYELELGVLVGTGNPLGVPIGVDEAAGHLFGMVLVNDWSARDIQKWEYVPLGPFLSKSFATSVSPWVVTLEALEPFRVAGPPQDPQPLDYLRSAGDWAYDIRLEAYLSAPALAEPFRLTATNFRHLYWNVCQQVAHHTVGGCNLQTGDLLASGTISGPEVHARACLLELTAGGKQPLILPGGLERRFLEDGDTLMITGWAKGAGYRIGFGEVAATILPAL